MEYMTFGKPIVTYDLKETRFSARNAALYVDLITKWNLQTALQNLWTDLICVVQLGEFGRQRVERELQWDVVGQNLLRAYEAVLTGV